MASTCSLRFPSGVWWRGKVEAALSAAQAKGSLEDSTVADCEYLIAGVGSYGPVK